MFKFNKEHRVIDKIIFIKVKIKMLQILIKKLLILGMLIIEI